MRERPHRSYVTMTFQSAGFNQRVQAKAYS
jgi:hypothetical protein